MEKFKLLQKNKNRTQESVVSNKEEKNVIRREKDFIVSGVCFLRELKLTCSPNSLEAV